MLALASSLRRTPHAGQVTPSLRRPRLIHVTTVASSLYFLQGQARFMANAGMDVLLVSSPGPLLNRFASSEGLPVVPIPMTRSITPLRDLKSLWRLLRLMRDVRPDIVHAHTPKAGILAMLAASIARVPVRIYHLHGLRAATARGLRRRLLLSMERAASRLATHVFSVSSSLQDLVVRSGLCSAEKIATPMHGTINGVDAVHRFNPARQSPTTGREVRLRWGIPQDAIVVGFVGRIARDKGWVELAGAWRDLRPQFPQLHLLVVGPLETHDPVPADVIDLLRTDPRVHWIGEQWEIPPLYAAMDLVVLPTYREGFPTVLLEAAAMQRPSVTTDAIGCVDAVEHGVTGLLVPIGDAGQLALAMARYAGDPELRQRHGAAARRRVLSNYQQEPLWQAILQRYRLMLAGKRLGKDAASTPPASRQAA